MTERRPTVPGPLASLVMQCLAKRPADRFQDADELLLHLGAVPISSGGMTPSPGITPGLGVPQALAGDHHEARSAIDKLVERSSETYVSPAYIANVHMGLGDAAATCEWLEKAFDERSGALVYMHVDPQLDGLRDDPGLRSLQERMRFPR